MSRTAGSPRLTTATRVNMCDASIDRVEDPTLPGQRYAPTRVPKDGLYACSTEYGQPERRWVVVCRSCLLLLAQHVRRGAGSFPLSPRGIFRSAPMRGMLNWTTS